MQAFEPYIPLLYYHNTLIGILLAAIDVIVQLAICYICLTMGSHANLRKFQLTLDLTKGVPTVVFSRIREFAVDYDFDPEVEQSNGVEMIESSASINYDIIRPRG